MLSELALPPETEEIGQFCSCGGLKTDVADKIMKKKTPISNFSCH